jgi:hypothetical protein
LISLRHESPIHECAGETITAVHEGEGDSRYVETARKPAGFRLSRVPRLDRVTNGTGVPCVGVPALPSTGVPTSGPY